MKKIIYCSLIISVIIGITGCASRPEEVELKTSKDIVKYARKNFGKAKYVEQESGKNSVKYTLQDNEYKFNYECVSKVDNFPCSSLYYETTECNFEEKYSLRGFRSRSILDMVVATAKKEASMEDVADYTGIRSRRLAAYVKSSSGVIINTPANLVNINIKPYGNNRSEQEAEES